jgi:hypothetical protein
MGEYCVGLDVVCILFDGDRIMESRGKIWDVNVEEERCLEALAYYSYQLLLRI